MARGFSYVAHCDQPLWRQRLDASLARCEAAWALSRSRLALGASSAALVLGLWVRTAEPDVLLLTEREPSSTTSALPRIDCSEDGRVAIGRAPVRLRRRLSAVDHDDRQAVGALIVTAPMRTAVDCAFDLPARESITVIDSAMRVLVQPERFRPNEAEARWRRIRRELLARIEAQPGRRGAVRARAVAAIASPFSESPGESVLRWQVAALGLPPPVLQHRVDADEVRRTYYLDLAWPGLRIAFEYDGRDKYAGLGSAWEEKERQDALHALGWRFKRFTSRHLADPALLERDALALFPVAVLTAVRRVPALYM